MSERVLVYKALVVPHVAPKLWSGVLVRPSWFVFRLVIEDIVTLILESFRLIKIKMILRLILNCWIIQILVLAWKLLSRSKLIDLRCSSKPWIWIGRLALKISGRSLRKQRLRVVYSTGRRGFSFNLINLILVMIDVRIQFVELLQKHHTLVRYPYRISSLHVLLEVKLTLRSWLWDVSCLLVS